MKKNMLRFLKNTYPLLVCLFLNHIQLQAQNLLTNGDFENGGSGIGFLVHDYTLLNPINGSSTPGTYGRTTNANLVNTTFNSGNDHTSGSGNMLVFDGATQANKYFWTTGNTGGAIGGFIAGTTYTFSFWIKSVSNEVTSDEATRAKIGVFFVNTTNINPSNLNTVAPLPAEGWKKIAYSFVANANNVMVRLKTNLSGPIGNDFAVDDFSITAGALPFTGSFTTVNPTCPNNLDGFLSVNLTGGTLPYSTYVLSGSQSQTSNNGLFTGLGEGTYSIRVSDSNGLQYTQTGIQLTAPNNLQVSSPVTICLGVTTRLSVSGGLGTYNWTSNPPDNTIVNPNNAIQNVNPAITTTYLVSSGAVSSGINLVENGDFSLGNTLFTNEYTQIDNPSPFGVQSSYNIVTNPNAWFSPFSSCGDNTTGSGNMIVFDGSTDPTGNSIAWNNTSLIPVVPNTNYTFSYYVASISSDNPAKLEVTINDVSLGTPIQAPGTTCLWTKIASNWNSGTNTTANIKIYDRNFIDYGNDFALDDLSLKETITCLYQKSVIITVNQPITPSFTAISPSCSGTIIPALPTTSNDGYTGIWSPNLDNSVTKTYTFVPTSGQCALPANLTVSILSLPQFTISEGCKAARYTLNAEQTSALNSSYSWSFASGSPIGNNASLEATLPGNYSLTITQNGCSNSETIPVTTPYCEIQKGISANNDGLNDYFNLEGFNVKKLKIFNRNGILVYTKAAYENEWYGQSDNGDKLPDGTYYFVIDFQDLNTKTGWIYINREQ